MIGFNIPCFNEGVEYCYDGIKNFDKDEPL